MADRYPRRGLHGEIVEKMGMLIVGGSYMPGDLLLAETLEKQFSVSKTVVREALKVLGAKGIVESRPKRGTVIRPRSDWSVLDPDLLRWQHQAGPSQKFLTDLAEIRLMIEPGAARLAADRSSDADLDALDSALIRMQAAGSDPREVIASDLAFHRALLVASHNVLLLAMDPVIETGLRIRDALVHRLGRGADTFEGHLAIVKAIRNGDSKTAIECTTALLEQSMFDADEALKKRS